MLDYKASFTTDETDFPNTLAVNVTAPGAGDGTEFVAALVNDIWGRAQAILSYASMSPNGVSEAAGTAQILTAIKRGFAVGPGMGVIYWKNGSPSTNNDRVLLLQGQTIAISGYADLVSACYVGDALNATAACFYKTSDAGGTTRDTAGAYFVLPDTRAVSLKGIGNQTINTRVKIGPASLGSVIEDTMQKLTGYWDFGAYTPMSADPTFSGALSGTDLANITAFSAASVVTRYNNLNFDSSNSPDARTSSTTAGQTQDCTIGTNFGITY